ncbi:MAG: LamG domain-containing protein [Phycisphaerales bacterium]
MKCASRKSPGLVRALVVACGALLAAPAIAQTTFETLSVTPQEEWGTTIERMGTGYVMAGNIRLNNSLSVLVRRSDQFGNAVGVAWTYSRPGGGDMTAQSVRIARDKSIVVAGEVAPGGDGTHGIYLMKIDPVTGAVIWCHVYRGTAFTGLGGTVVRELQGPAGGFVLIGRLQNAANSQLGGVLITTDAAGVQTCGTLYTTPAGALGSIGFNDVRQNPDNTFTISGMWRDQVQAPLQPLVLRTRCNANPVWARTYINPAIPGEGYGEGLDLALVSSPIGQDLTAVTGPWRNNGNAVGSLQIVLTGNNGAPLSEVIYSNFLEAQSIRVTPGLRTLIAGKVSTAPVPPSTLLNGGLMRLNMPGGGFITARELASVVYPNSREFLEEAIRTPDGGASATGDGLAYPFTPSRELMHLKTNVGLTSPVECDTPRQFPVNTATVSTARQMVINPIPPQLDVVPIFAERQMEQPDVCDERHGCTTAPGGLQLWLPFDENGGIAANVANAAFPGTHINGPAFTGGAFVANSRFYDAFNDFTQVNNYPGINPGSGNFTIDAWINAPGVLATQQTIVDKSVTITPGTFQGYRLYTQGGTLRCTLATGGAPVVFNSGLAVPTNAWTFVAMVYNSTANTVTFYVNGTSATLPAAAAAGNKSTTAPFRVASAQGAPSLLFRGNIDEVEFFRTALTAAQLDNIRLANSSGKCKDLCRNGSGAYCQPTQVTTNVTLWVCNYGVVPTTYSYNVQGLPVGVGCSVAGPTGIAPSSGVTGIVNPGQCIPVPFVVTKPAGMAAAGDTGCFQVEFTNNTTGNIFTCNGTVVQGGPLCGFTPVPIDTELKLAEGVLTTTNFSISNSDPAAQTVNLRYFWDRDVYSDDPFTPGDEPGFVSLNGLPPGEPILRTVTIPGNQTRTFPIFLTSLLDDPVSAGNIIIEADLDGDGEWEPISRMAIRPESPNPCDSIDFNNDTSVFDPIDIDALLSVYGEGPCIPDTAICNDIDFNNDGSVFDPCDIDSFLLVFSEGPCTPCGQ